MKKFSKLFVAAAALIIALVLVLVIAGANPAATTPEEAFAKYLRVVDVGLLNGGRNTSTLSALVPTAAEVGPALAAQAQRLVVYERTKAVDFGAWAARHGDTYKSVTSVPTTRSVSVVGSRATIVEDVVTTMRWSSSATSNVTLDPHKALDVQKAKKAGRAFGPGEIITSIVSTQHTVTLVLVNRSWKVMNDLYVDPFNESNTDNHASALSKHSAVYSEATAYLQSFLVSWQKNGFYAAGQKYLDPTIGPIPREGNPVLIAGTVDNMRPYSWLSADNFVVLVDLHLRFSTEDAGAWGNGVNTRFVTFARSSVAAPYKLTLNSGP